MPRPWPHPLDPEPTPAGRIARRVEAIGLAAAMLTSALIAVVTAIG